MRLNDATLGLLIALLGVLIFHAASGLPTARHIQYGPGFMPSIVAVGLMLCGTVLVVRDVVAQRRFRLLVEKPEWYPVRGLRVSMCRLGVALVGYPLVLPWAGFLIATPIFLTLLFRNGGYPIVWSLVVSILMTLAMQVIFIEIFLIPMPQGLLEGIQPSLSQLWR